MNKYEIVGIVGEGAYGIVYKAKNKENGESGKYFRVDNKKHSYSKSEIDLKPENISSFFVCSGYQEVQRKHG
jgi:serine/threonine protein kinase